MGGPALRAAAGIAVSLAMDAIIKGMAAHYAVPQVTFMRFACGTVVALGVVAAMRPGWPSRETVLANGLRSVVAVLTASSFFYALQQLPLAETLVLSFLAPMFVALFGRIFLRERVDGRIGIALVAGFIGTLVVVLGQNEASAATRSTSGVVAALASAVLYAPLGGASAPARAEGQVHPHRGGAECRADAPDLARRGGLLADADRAAPRLVHADGRARRHRPHPDGDGLRQGRGGAPRLARIHGPDLGGALRLCRLRRDPPRSRRSPGAS